MGDIPAIPIWDLHRDQPDTHALISKIQGRQLAELDRQFWTGLYEATYGLFVRL